MTHAAKLIASIIGCALLAIPALGQTITRREATTAPSGLPTPRFVSLNAAKANMRAGPGEQYPILWVYLREGLPLEVTDEYGAWRRIRDHQGTTGWMHGALLSGRRTGVVTGATRTLYSKPDTDATALLRAEPGVILRIESCAAAWCEVAIHGREGWLPQEHFWGTYTGEELR